MLRRKPVMNKKEKILRIRPFNMANFSGAGGYIPMYSIFGAIFSFPATFLLWSGLAISLKKEDGKLNYTIIKRRLKRIILPICLLFFVLFAIICINQLSFYGVNASAILLSIWFSSVYSVGMYLPIFYSAKILDEKGNLTKKRWLLLTLALALAMAIIGIAGTFLLFLV